MRGYGSMTQYNTEHQGRRGFLVRATQALSALIGGALGIPAFVYLFTPAKSRSTGGWVDAGDISQLKLNAPEELPFRRVRMDGWKIITEKSTAWVVRLSDKEVVAYTPQCTHLGCAYHWEESKGQFLCPCHTSNFSIDGKVLNGPAPRPLDRYLVKVEGDRLLIGPEQSKAKGA